jgi:hypothetical protein
MVTTLTIMTAAGCASPAAENSMEPHSVGSFSFSVPGREPIRVFYAVGSGNLEKGGRVVVVMHGTERNASDYRDAWVPLIKDEPWVVVAPEFDKASFPGVAGYNLGGVVDGEEDARPQRDWTFAYIAPLVERTRRMSGAEHPDFDMFGHSAGAQFVHRYLEFEPLAPVRRAVAANAGWYTMPDPEVAFPYGMADAPAPVGWSALFGRDLHILLGSEDVDDENLRQDHGATVQGSTRIERGETFYEAGSEQARLRGDAFNWALQIVPGVSHDHVPMSAAAAQLFAR